MVIGEGQTRGLAGGVIHAGAALLAGGVHPVGGVLRGAARESKPLLAGAMTRHHNAVMTHALHRDAIAHLHATTHVRDAPRHGAIVHLLAATVHRLAMTPVGEAVRALAHAATGVIAADP